MPSLRIPGIKTAYGLDLRGDRLFLVRADLVGREIRCEMVRGAGAESAARKTQERGRSVAVGSMRVRDSVTRRLAPPLTSVKKAREVLPALLDIELPFPLEQSVYDFPVVEKEAGGSVWALGLAARQSTVEARLNQYRVKGWDPEFLEHEGVALWDRALDETPPGAPVRVVAHLGEERCLLVVGHGLDFMAAHGSPVGFPEGAFPVEARLKDFIAKARRLLMAEAPSAGPGKLEWVWTGPGAAYPAVIERLEEELRSAAPVLFESVEEPDAFLARALAVRGLRAPRTGGDFRIGAWMHPRVQKQKADRRNLQAASFAAAALLVIGVQTGWMTVLKNRDAALQQALTEKARELAPGSRIQRGQEVQTVRSSPEQQVDLQRPFMDAFAAARDQLLGQVLTQAQTQGIRLHTCDLEDDRVNLRGSAPDAARRDLLAAFLQSQGFVVTVAAETGGADGSVRFTLRGVKDHAG